MPVVNGTLSPNSIVTPQQIWSATAVATTANTTYTDSPTTRSR